MIDTQAALSFRRLALTTVIAVYILILIGGIVRASGAGMGCPDWPKCFGRWVPPTEESQLPADYRQRYSSYENMQFNPVKTWTEYLNRLSGATIGILIFLTAWKSRIYLKSDKTVSYLAWLVFMLVGFQGWLGSTVVASNLKPVIITLHMLLALLIVAMLIYILARSQKVVWDTDFSVLPVKFNTVLIAAMAMTLLQVAMGTQVREAVDMIANEHAYIGREYWRDDFPIIFYVHRSFSSVILFTNAWLFWQIYHGFAKNALIFKIGLLLMGLIVTGIIAGITLDRLGMPPIVQPIHLVVANLIFGTQFFLYSHLRFSK